MMPTARLAAELEANPFEDNKAACLSLQQLSQTYSTHITLAEAEGALCLLARN
mgnify:FL=1